MKTPLVLGSGALPVGLWWGRQPVVGTAACVGATEGMSAASGRSLWHLLLDCSREGGSASSSPTSTTIISQEGLIARAQQSNTCLGVARGSMPITLPGYVNCRLLFCGMT